MPTPGPEDRERDGESRADPAAPRAPCPPRAPTCCTLRQERKEPAAALLGTEHASRPRRGTQALGGTPHRTVVDQPSRADPPQRGEVLALGPDSPSAVPRARADRAAAPPRSPPATHSHSPQTPTRTSALYILFLYPRLRRGVHPMRPWVIRKTSLCRLFEGLWA
jgi:hypothetical protein